jgi:hypothetical protein
MQAPNAKLLQRIQIEKRIARRVVRHLLQAGYRLTVDNGGDTYEIPYTYDFKTIVGAMFATDDERLVAEMVPPAIDAGSAAWAAYKAILGDRKTIKGWVYFVYGNDGYDVISDYTLNLEQVIQPVLDYAEGLEAN